MASSSISVDEPLMLLVALYVRDVAGLRPPLEYDVPPLDPPVLRESGGTDDDGSNQWAVWWQELLRGGGMWPAYADPAKMSEIREDPDIQRLFYWPGRYAPPDFPSLHTSPELHRDVCGATTRPHWRGPRHASLSFSPSPRLAPTVGSSGRS